MDEPIKPVHYLNLHQVPMPFVQCYNEQGEIMTSPAFLALAEIVRNMKTPCFSLISRQAAPEITVCDWKPLQEEKKP